MVGGAGGGEVQSRVDGIDVAHVGGGVWRLQRFAGKPLIKERGAPGVGACGGVVQPGNDLLRVDPLEDAGEVLEVQALVLETKLKMPAKGVAGLVLRGPGADLGRQMQFCAI